MANYKLQEYEILKVVSENHDALIFVNDPVTYECKYINKQMAGLLKVDPKGILGRKCHDALWGKNRPCASCPLEKLRKNGAFFKENSLEWEFKNKRLERWYRRKDSVIEWVDGSLVHLYVAGDITMRKDYEEQLKFSASMDAMTGTFNREWGLKLMERAFQEARISGTGHSLCFIDLDHLKATNDKFGHDAGDEMILKIIYAIRKTIRKNDFICRWGGDEFIILLRCNLEYADLVIRKIQAELDLVNRDYPSERPPLAFSYGIADLAAADTVEKVIGMADKAMYLDKMRKYNGGTTR